MVERCISAAYPPHRHHASAVQQLVISLLTRPLDAGGIVPLSEETRCDHQGVVRMRHESDSVVPVTEAHDPSTTDPAATEFSAATTAQILTTACARVGLDAREAELLRLGENAVYQLAARPVVVRIARSAAYLSEIKTGVAVAQWLRDVGFPAARLVADVEQPLVLDDLVVTFWEVLSSEYATVADLAVLLRRLHALEPSPSLAPPALRPLDRTVRRIKAADLPADDKRFLTDRVEQLASRWATLDFVLPAGLIHGDASIGNVIRAHDGHPVLIDLDGFSIGPREWDLVLTALYYERFGWHTSDEYKQFAELYGFDVMTWPGYHVLRSMRELIMVGWLSQNTGHSSEIADEVAKRVEDLRTGREGRLDWKPF